MVAARGFDGAYADWGVIENRHHNHILDISHRPAVSDGVAEMVARLTRKPSSKHFIAACSVAVEFFGQRADGRLLINGVLLRAFTTSRHLTFDASVTSQFEIQQLPAVCPP